MNHLGLQSWSSMVNDGLMSQCAKDCLNMKINHGLTSHCDKHRLSMKTNDGKSWSSMFILEFIIFILGFLHLEFIIFIP